MGFKWKHSGSSKKGLDHIHSDLEPIVSPQKLQNMVRDSSGSSDILLESKLYMEGVGPVIVTLSKDFIIWQGVGGGDQLQDDAFSNCKQDILLCFKDGNPVKLLGSCGSFPLNEVYGVEKSGYGPVAVSNLSASWQGLVYQVPQFHRFTLHTFVRADNASGQWVPKQYTFGHQSEETCMVWLHRVKELLLKKENRPRKLLVIVNPYGGKKNAALRWKQVSPIFDRAGIETQVITTTHRGHAREIMQQSSDEELSSTDGVVVVGGDGLFNEVLNGLASKYHHARAAPVPYTRDETFSVSETDNVSCSLNQKGKEPAGLLDTCSEGYNRFTDDSSKAANETESLLLPSSTTTHSNGRREPFASNESMRHTHETNDNYENTGSGLEGEWASRGKRHCDESRYFEKLSRGAEGEGFGEGEDSVYQQGPSDMSYDQCSNGAQEIQTTNQQNAAESLPLGNVRNGAEVMLDADVGLTTNEKKLRIGIIPAGSTDTILMSTTGSRDHVTAAIHIVLGDRMPLDIVRITGWRGSQRPNKEGRSIGSTDEIPSVRYAASFCGYGFYGDVAQESEQFRWMGPARYDYAGFMTYLRHRQYEAEVSFLKMPSAQSESIPHRGPWPAGLTALRGRKRHNPGQVVCRTECSVCATGQDLSQLAERSDREERERREGEEEETENSTSPARPKWTSVTGRFHSVGAAVMSCRNEKAPDGVAAHAHLADGLLHLILVRECSRPEYLLQLLRLTWKGADPLDFKFVECHKTPAFTFMSHGRESVWNVDGELFPAHKLSAQVFRGLVDVFARGPEN